jgi:hypothetical protein
MAVDQVWKTSLTEVRGLTFPQTNEIYEGRGVSGLSVDDIIVVNNVKHAWQALLASAEDVALTWTAVLDYNRLLGEQVVDRPGFIRDHAVRITGTSYAPGPVTLESVNQSLLSAMTTPDPEGRALAVYRAITREQWFNDGNKRTAALAANHVLVNENIGLFGVDIDLQEEFTTRLVEFYESGDHARFDVWLKDNAVHRVPGGLTTTQERAVRQTNGERRGHNERTAFVY